MAWWIVVLVLIGGLLYFAELVLPGITVAGIGALCAFVTACVMGFIYYDAFWGGVTIAAVAFIVIILTVLFLRPKTWRKVALNAEIKEPFQPKAENDIAVGSEGETLTRLAPMGKVMIEGKAYEAKSLDCFIDQKTAVVVTGYENSSLIVKAK